MKLSTFVLAASAVIAGAASTLTATDARAVGAASGTVGSGGTAAGDISMQAGETDTVTVDVAAGATYDVVFKAGFAAALTLTDPNDGPVDVGFVAGSKSLTLRNHAFALGGTHRFTIASADGSQGRYRLLVRPRWAPRVPVSGAGSATVAFEMPAASKFSVKLGRAAGAPGLPRIAKIDGPSGSVVGAVEPVRGRVALRPTAAAAAGTYRMDVEATDGTSGWLGTVVRMIPRTRPTNANLANGLDQVSFSQAGVDAIFRRRCADCHGWAAGYTGVKQRAASALGKIRSGSMPPAGPLPADQVALIQAWISTGRAR